MIKRRASDGANPPEPDDSIWKRAYERMWITASAQKLRAERAEANAYDLKTLSDTMLQYSGSACKQFVTKDGVPRCCDTCGCPIFQHLARTWGDQLCTLIGGKVEP